MLVLIIIEVVLFFINPTWGLIGIPVCVLLYILFHSSGNTGELNNDEWEDEEINWELDDLDKK